MSRNLLFIVLFLSYAQSSWALIPETKPSQSVKADSSCWQFQNRTQMERLIKRWWDNPRASYYIINNAYARQLALPAALIYLNHSQQGINKKRVVLAAYACMVASGSFSFRIENAYSKDMQTVSSYGAFTHGMLDDALKEFPDSSEILVMVAACRTDANIGLSPPSEAWPSILALLRRAKNLDPRWADIYYWEGLVLDLYGERGVGRKTQALALAKPAILTAQRLDPAMQKVCYRMLGLIAEDRGAYQESLNYIDAWLRLQPQSARMPNIQIWRKRVADALNAQNS